MSDQHLNNFRDGSIGSGPNTFDPSEFPSLGGGGGGQGMAGRPNYGKLARTHSRQLDLGGTKFPSVYI